MPSYNLPDFSPITSPRSPRPPSTPRPVLSVIQPPNTPRSKALSNAPPPSPCPPSVPTPDPPRRHLRAMSSPPAYLSLSSVSLPPPPPRRKPLSARYTRPASSSHLFQRSPLQSHSLPSFSLSHPASSSSSSNRDGNDRRDGNDGTTLFEELLSKTLERKLRERVLQGKHAKGGERMGLGGLKPGREMLIWSAVNRCSSSSSSSSTAITPSSSSSSSSMVGVVTWKESGLGGGGGGGAGKREYGVRPQHRRSQTLPEKSSTFRAGGRSGGGKPKKEKEEEEEDDDDEPLGRKLQEAIEKREKQIVKLQAERARKSLEQENENRQRSIRRNSEARGGDENRRVVEVQVKIKLPTSPKPVFLKPDSGPSTPSSASKLIPSSPPLLSPPSLLDLGPPLFPFNPSSSYPDLPRKGDESNRPKRLRKNPSTPLSLASSSSSSSPSTRPPDPTCTLRYPPESRLPSFLPTRPPRTAHPSETNISLPTRLPLYRSKSDNPNPNAPTMMTGGTSSSCAKIEGPGRSRKVSLGMKRTRSDNVLPLRIPVTSTSVY